MLSERLVAEVKSWISDDPDPKTRAQLQEWLDRGATEELTECFQGFLEFGTAGLRGPLGPGPSRMNRCVVSKTAYGLSRFMSNAGLKSIVIGRDARYGSEDFTRDTAEIMSGAGFEVFVLPRALPTPVLAFAVRKLGCDVGVMVTASHNPPQDNGYKVYLGGTVNGIRYEGSQIISPTDKEISAEISAAPSLNQVPRGTTWTILSDEIVNEYIATTARLGNSPIELKVVYTAMHGVGTETVLKVFDRAGFTRPILVKEQAEPDPDFPTVAFPNPEEPGAIDLSLKLAREVEADLVIANDPDADRCAAAINDGNWRMLRGDEVGALLGEYLARTCEDKSAVLANSIVSSSILSKIAKSYGLPFVETLTGFKYLAKVANLRFGYEEALGYAVDADSVNDKDGISAALVLVQLAADLKREGKTIAQLLNEIWKKYGFHGTRQISVRTQSISDIDKVMGKLRNNLPTQLSQFKVTQVDDLERPKDGLPPTNGVRIWLDEKYRVIVRPSGTEPKIKCYIEVVTNQVSEATTILDAVEREFRALMAVN
ncbi:MAG: phospho-sugar mutase [Actinobacteria bacterium]|nr:phospho-sugar mutase [Actinomycetota bacterium]NDE83316.1 phospho-sugar mutase [Actinomycetota bacterium]